jgi:ABC-type branched-subunit amino acid transport system permease subunit
MRKQMTGAADYIRITLKSNWFYLAVLIFLILFPHIVGLITGDSPFGVGGRPRGQSVYWQSIFIEVFILAILAMSYNLMFGFSGVISFGHALFFGLGGYTLVWSPRWSGWMRMPG